MNDQTIDKELLSIMNEEILMMRKELHAAYREFMMVFYTENDVERAWAYFSHMPSLDRKGKSSAATLLDCCEIAKIHREENE